VGKQAVGGHGNGPLQLDGNEWTFIAETNGFAITALGTARGYKSPGRQTLWAGTAGTVEEGINKIVCFELEDTKTVFQHGGKDLAVSPDDAHRYEDIPKEGHTAVGYAGRLNARYTGETVGVFGSYEKIPLTLCVWAGLKDGKGNFGAWAPSGRPVPS